MDSNIDFDFYYIGCCVLYRKWCDMHSFSHVSVSVLYFLSPTHGGRRPPFLSLVLLDVSVSVKTELFLLVCGGSGWRIESKSRFSTFLSCAAFWKMNTIWISLCWIWMNLKWVRDGLQQIGLNWNKIGL